MAERYDFYVHDNRKITFNLTEPIMREDSGVTDFVFHIPKVLNELEVSDWAWWLVFVNAKKEKYSIALTLSDDPESPLEKNIGIYTVDYAMSIKAGAVQFALEAINAGTGGAIDNEWHTLTYETKVKETLQGNQAEYAETESDIISELLIEVRNKINQLVGGATPTPVNLKSLMTDPQKVYLYTGTEQGEYTGNWYYHNGTQFVHGGVYGAGVVDSVPTQGSANAVSSGGVYEALAGKVDDETGKGLSTNDYSDAEKRKVTDATADLFAMTTATAEDEGKALKAKTVTNGKVIEWEFGEAGGGDISAFTDSIPEYLKASDATNHQWYKDATGATQTTSSINACTFGVVIPIEAGRTYYYKDIIGSKSWYRYADGTTGRVVNTVNNNLYSGTFTATKDGTVICSGLTANASTAIWTADESIYNAGLQEDKTILKTDSTLTSADLPANAKAVRDALEGFDADINAVNAIVEGVDNEFFDSSFGRCSIDTTNHVITKSATGNLYGSGFFRIIPYVTYESNALWSNQWCYVYDKDGNYVCSLNNDGNDAVYTQHINTKKSTFCVTNPDAYTVILVMSVSSASGYTDISIRALSESESMSMLDINTVSALKHRLCSVSPYMYGKKWAVLGDSITAGDGLTTNILTRYSTLVEKQCGIIAYNYGYSGSRIAVQGSAGDSTYDNAMVIRYANMIDDADYITVLGGINDANNQLPLGTLGDTDIATFYGALEVLITGLLTKYPGKAIGFITYPHYQGSERHRTYVDAIKEACARYAIPVLDLHSIGGMNTMTTEYSQMFYSDGLHPNELGQAVMARKICAFLGTL